MGIQLLSISYKTADKNVRERVALNEAQKRTIIDSLAVQPGIEEIVVLATCNRTEIYCSGENDRKNLQQMKQILLKETGADNIAGIGDCIFRFVDGSAAHHLFMVAAGLDSMVLGEDQILGQVKSAYFFSEERNLCKKQFHLLFQMAVTAAKKVKTETLLSKLSVSTASLALKKAGEVLGGLSGKKIMVIGGSGQIGGVVLKNLRDISGVRIFATTRREHKNMDDSFTVISYHDRYEWMRDMDVVISATTSPHYTVTYDRFLQSHPSPKQRIFIDLAVPSDIEETVALADENSYFCMEDIAEMARQNNMEKMAQLSAAEEIIAEYESDFLKEMLFEQNQKAIRHFRESMASAKSEQDALNRFVFLAKKYGSTKEFEDFIKIIQKILKEGS